MSTDWRFLNLNLNEQCLLLVLLLVQLGGVLPIIGGALARVVEPQPRRESTGRVAESLSVRRTDGTNQSRPHTPCGDVRLAIHF